jgi:uncharacterized protein YjbI with pentapeptide repeats
MITGRTEAMPANFEALFFSPHKGEYAFNILKLAPFNKTQVEEFIGRFVKASKAVWKEPKAYQDRIASISGLDKFVETPITLSMILEILPKLTDNGSLNRSQLFHKYTTGYLDSQNAKLKGVGYLGKRYRDYCEHVALLMLIGGSNNLALHKDLPKVDPEIRIGVPISEVDGGVSFTHKSLSEYFAACAIRNMLSSALGLPDQLLERLPEFMRCDLSTLQFLREMVSPMEIQEWMGVIAGSAGSSSSKTPALLASIAATAMCGLNRGMCDQKWSGAQLANAHLQHAHLSGTDFTGANLAGAFLDGVCLDRVQLAGANLDGVSFGQNPSCLGHTAQVNSVVFSPDGKFIVSGSWDKTVRVWDANNGVEVDFFSSFSGLCFCLLTF